MTATYRMILIDPVERTIKHVHSSDAHRELSLIVGTDDLETFRIADHDRQWDYGIVDDKGLSRGAPVHAFKFDINPDPVAGRCLMYGAEKDGGATCDVAFPIEKLRQSIEWLGLIVPHVEWIEHERGLTANVTWKPA